MLAKVSFKDCDLGSLLVTYLVQYRTTLCLDTMNCMSTLAHQADSWMGLKLLIIPSLQAVRITGSSSVILIVVDGCRSLGYPTDTLACHYVYRDSRLQNSECGVAGHYKI